ncbi:BRICHOS-like domain-containing protein out at first isoform X1 [Lycorma delicatula]|uniref:BRICHOS-like domain-containing protein out at first isoform X1 n=1 Tax=Lycorma delicatula TaxID=130591 RepID=UPI003F514FFF
MSRSINRGLFRLGIIVLLYCIDIGNTQLLINVKNQGGDVVQETIAANVTEDSVMLEFQRSDGTLITQLVDFRHEVQILKALVLGEEERGQSQYQVMCFVCHIHKEEFISSDAMAKLRQKNPGTIRTAEEDRGRENYRMDLFVDVPRSGVISKHIATLCSEAKDATYTRRSDLNRWASQSAVSLHALLDAVKEYPTSLQSNTLAEPSRCLETPGLWTPCTCHLEMCIGWYPCSLKYCKGKAPDTSSYRCGIKTCRKCSQFSYYVRQKQLCLWDE